MIRFSAPWILLALLASGPAPADAPFRCGSKIIEVGMSMPEVLDLCGEPASRRVEKHDVRSGNRVVGTTDYHFLTYGHPGGTTRTLEFDQEKLVAIR